MGVKRMLRLHFPSGNVVVEDITKTARMNGTDVAGAKALVAEWVAAGDLVPRSDGGYDVKRWRKRKVGSGR